MNKQVRLITCGEYTVYCNGKNVWIEKYLIDLLDLSVVTILHHSENKNNK
ncbi:protein of unknown function [Candidatus Nitrosocosmicus franklandus]|uniref:Uncharacterized protein n=1 Tax=Candidatus Nitrosocosmicus franklandianus TaxID=1798806 RepID=A0A484I870_9ARCH|nr:protein of unknown function [Candidatus Nitrosocosmicus franklandus]